MFERRARGTEFLDRPNADPRLVEQSYQFMKVVNRIGGGIRVVRRFLAQELSQSARDTITVLDLGAADCDIPLALLHWAARRGYKVRFTCLDHDPKAVELAQRAVARHAARVSPTPAMVENEGGSGKRSLRSLPMAFTGGASPTLPVQGVSPRISARASWVAAASILSAFAGRTLADGSWNARNTIGKLRRLRLPLPPATSHLDRGRRALPHHDPPGEAGLTPPAIEVVQADIFTYQPAEAFDYAVGSMFFHHFTDDEIDRLITHLRGFVRRALLINDLHRCLANYLACLILALPIDPAIRHDALLSIRRGFKPHELAQRLARHDPKPAVRRMWFCRVAGVVRFDREGNV